MCWRCRWRPATCWRRRRPLPWSGPTRNWPPPRQRRAVCTGAGAGSAAQHRSRRPRAGRAGGAAATTRGRRAVRSAHAGIVARRAGAAGLVATGVVVAGVSGGRVASIRQDVFVGVAHHGRRRFLCAAADGAGCGRQRPLQAAGVSSAVSADARHLTRASHGSGVCGRAQPGRRQRAVAGAACARRPAPVHHRSGHVLAGAAADYRVGGVCGRSEGASGRRSVVLRHERHLDHHPAGVYRRGRPGRTQRAGCAAARERARPVCGWARHRGGGHRRRRRVQGVYARAGADGVLAVALRSVQGERERRAVPEPVDGAHRPGAASGTLHVPGAGAGQGAVRLGAGRPAVRLVLRAQAARPRQRPERYAVAGSDAIPQFEVPAARGCADDGRPRPHLHRGGQRVRRGGGARAGARRQRSTGHRAQPPRVHVAAGRPSAEPSDSGADAGVPGRPARCHPAAVDTAVQRARTARAHLRRHFWQDRCGRPAAARQLLGRLHRVVRGGAAFLGGAARRVQRRGARRPAAVCDQLVARAAAGIPVPESAVVHPSGGRGSGAPAHRLHVHEPAEAAAVPRPPDHARQTALRHPTEHRFRAVVSGRAMRCRTRSCVRRA
eukprot:ctg_1157.g282